jgi:multiple sugar transport system permease protein
MVRPARVDLGHEVPVGPSHSPGPFRASKGPGPSRPTHLTVRPHQVVIWVGPALALILGVVGYPAVQLVISSFSEFSITGLLRGPAGFDNYVTFLASRDLPQVLWNTLVWVVSVTAGTIVLGLGFAQFLSKQFAGRRFVRWAVLVPWAAALVITSQLFRQMLDYYHGVVNLVLTSLGVISEPIDWLGRPGLTMPTMIAVGIFVSIPFTAYLLLGGLNSIPNDVYEAAQIDGASGLQVYRLVTLPLLAPSIIIAVLLNVIYVFNSFPVIWVLNGSNPGYGNDTLITYMYKLAFRSAEHDVGLSAAAGVINVLIMIFAVATYLRLTNRANRA